MIDVNKDSLIDDRLNAVRRFAQTMIVVDDEASLQLHEEVASQNLVAPGRGQSKAAAEHREEVGKNSINAEEYSHTLDGKLLVNSALKQGLVCSVVRPSPQESTLDAVVQAARQVDIVCLDWKVHDDDGSTAISLIKKIVEEDQSGEGRLRLIVIYTAERRPSQILDRIKRDLSAAFSAGERRKMKLQKVNNRAIVSSVGLKIVYLLKGNGARKTGRYNRESFSEDKLPEKALQEFAGLCEGLLANVALSTVAAVRDAAHQIVRSFDSEMDEPYFHHRATIRHPDEAEDYAVNTVLNSLRTAVRLKEVGRAFAGPEAVDRRIRELANNSAEFTMSYMDGKSNSEKSVNFSVDDVVRLILEGVERTYSTISPKGQTTPGKNIAKKSITSLFSGNCRDTLYSLKKFAALTSTGSHPETPSVREGEYVPSLGLGSVIKDGSGNYFLCIQASCDTVRIKSDQPFLFVPLKEVADGGEFVVPKEGSADSVEYMALQVEELGYAKGKSFVFSPDKATERVLAEMRGRPKRLRFKSTNNRTFEWVADLKHYQALHVAQKLGKEMGRLGFDQFEPFRVPNG